MSTKLQKGLPWTKLDGFLILFTNIYVANIDVRIDSNKGKGKIEDLSLDIPNGLAVQSQLPAASWYFQPLVLFSRHQPR